MASCKWVLAVIGMHLIREEILPSVYFRAISNFYLQVKSQSQLQIHRPITQSIHVSQAQSIQVVRSAAAGRANMGSPASCTRRRLMRLRTRPLRLSMMRSRGRSGCGTETNTHPVPHLRSEVAAAHIPDAHSHLGRYQIMSNR